MSGDESVCLACTLMWRAMCWLPALTLIGPLNELPVATWITSESQRWSWAKSLFSIQTLFQAVHMHATCFPGVTSYKTQLWAKFLFAIQTLIISKFSPASVFENPFSRDTSCKTDTTLGQISLSHTNPHNSKLPPASQFKNPFPRVTSYKTQLCAKFLFPILNPHNFKVVSYFWVWEFQAVHGHVTCFPAVTPYKTRLLFEPKTKIISNTRRLTKKQNRKHRKGKRFLTHLDLVWWPVFFCLFHKMVSWEISSCELVQP